MGVVVSEFPGVGVGRIEDDSVTYRGNAGWVESWANRQKQRADVRMELEGPIAEIEAKLLHVLDSLRAVKR